MGIETNKIDQIFGMFKRLHNHVEGSVIGLYIVKRIVENSGGEIEVESEPGKGTTFKNLSSNHRKLLLGLKRNKYKGTEEGIF